MRVECFAMMRLAVSLLLQFEAGDQVVITEDTKKAEELQAGYGGWVKTMAKVSVILACIYIHVHFIRLLNKAAMHRS